MTRCLDVALVSCRELPEPDPDAAPLAAALDAARLRHAVLAWDDPEVDWSAARLTVLRSCWDYPLKADRFRAWAERAARSSTLLNPLDVVLWNLHKRYLLDLEARGVPVVPTELLPRGARVPLQALLERRRWERAVVKPAISAASLDTIRVGGGDLSAAERHLTRLLARGDVLVQRYLHSVEGYGERALVVIEGEVTHAVRKSPRFAGDDESVSREAVPVSEAERALARRAMAAAGRPLLYGRVDVAPGPDGAPVVMELELIEPSLFFAQCPEALERFVAGLARRLAARG